MTSPVRVVLVDDHPSMRAGVRSLLEGHSEREGWNLEVVAEAGTGEQGLELVLAFVPDVLVTDLDLPGMSGVDLARAVNQADVGTHVLVLSAYDDPAYVRTLQEAGVKGFLTKEKPPALIAEAVRAVANGESRWFIVPRDRPFHELTPCEVRVLDELVKGRSNSEIARALFVTEYTVRNHLSNVYEKLGVSSAREAIVRALTWGRARPQSGIRFDL